jgi:hypothetical protein
MYSADEYYAVYDETCPTARKEHTCAACGEVIAKRQRYYRIALVFDGAASTVKRCVRCQRIHEHLRKSDTDGHRWPDELLNCGHEYEDAHGVAPPDEIAALAFALPGETD